MSRRVLLVSGTPSGQQFFYLRSGKLSGKALATEKQSCETREMQQPGETLLPRRRATRKVCSPAGPGGS